MTTAVQDLVHKYRYLLFDVELDTIQKKHLVYRNISSQQVSLVPHTKQKKAKKKRGLKLLAM